MSFPYLIQRTWLNVKRHMLTILLSIGIFSGIMLLMGAIYPGPDAVQDFMKIPTFQLFIGIQEVENPGMLVWLLFMSNVFNQIIFPVVGIFLGIRMLPFNENDGKELIFSTEKPPTRYFIENFLIVMCLIPLLVFPNFLFGTAFLYPTFEGIDALAISTFLPVFFVMVVAMITVFGASIKSSSRIGYAFGGTFFIFSFTLSLLQSELSFVKDINLMSQINGLGHALAGTWNDSTFNLYLFDNSIFQVEYNQYIITCLVLIAIFFILTIVFFYRTDFIEARSSYNKTLEGESNPNQGSIYNIKRATFSLIRTPVETVLSRLGWRDPAFRDQLQSSGALFIIYAFITSMLVIIVIFAYPGDVNMANLFEDAKSILDNPLIASFVFGHTMQPNLEGFLILKLMTFHWLYYGAYLFIATYQIVMRDKSGGYNEITWSMPRTRSKIIIQRTIAMIIYLWLILLINWISLWLGAVLSSLFSDVMFPDFGATILAFTFLGFGYSIFLIIFVTLALLPNSKYLMMILIVAFLLAIFFPMISYMFQDFSWIAYLSPFNYFDVVGLMLNDVNLLGAVIPGIIGIGAISIVFYVTSVIFWTPHRDIA